MGWGGRAGVFQHRIYGGKGLIPFFDVDVNFFLVCEAQPNVVFFTRT